MKTYLAIKWVDGGWLGGSFMYVFHTNQIWDSIKDQSNCGLYIWIVFMNNLFSVQGTAIFVLLQIQPYWAVLV